ncbi:MAG: lytic murein transglycosylase [Rhodospirillales bacterium]|nr:lytic murein transglycosylase [Rhodospirillales bacterium]
MGFLRNSKLLFAGLSFCFVVFASEQLLAAGPDYDTWKSELRVEALKKGISETIFDAAMKDVKPIKRVVELDRKQPEFTLTFQDYLQRVVPESRVKKARKKYAENKELLEEVGKKLGVQPRFLVAFWGIETDFGRHTGGFKVVDALVTLAFDGRRSAYFRKELFNALKILDQGHITVSNMMGSWAGAMGQCQFMPSSFLNFAIDYDGDGKKDIWKTKADVFGSAATYLSKSGWKADQTWGRAVKLPKGFDLSMAGIKKKSQKISYWQSLGVRRMDGTDLPARDIKASIVLGDGKKGPAYMVYNNYRTILKWNRSTYFAIAVGTLADRIVGR